MKVIELKLEYPGIFGTITNYTKNPYIVGYLKIMKEYIDSLDKENIIICLKKLTDWYNLNIEDIISNQYVVNKEDHLQTKMILENALSNLQ